MIYSVEKGAARYLDAIDNSAFHNDGFYASKETTVVGTVVDQFKIYPAMANPAFQDNACAAIHRFIH